MLSPPDPEDEDVGHTQDVTSGRDVTHAWPPASYIVMTHAQGAGPECPPNGNEALRVRTFAEQRERLLGVAYRILGRVADAEDVVQEAWLRWARIDSSAVDDPKAFLVRTATHLAIDRLRHIRRRREEYVGPWLPEPLLTSPDVAESVERSDSVSFALLVVLETLSPAERAVFVLHEVFAYSHAEIALILDRSETAIRQLAARARNHVQARHPRFESDLATRRRVTELFLTACTTGDPAAVVTLLAPGVRLLVDSGGKVPAARKPIVGADAAGRYLAGLRRADALARFLGLRADDSLPELHLRLCDVNGGPGIVITADRRPIGVIVLDTVDERISTVHLVVNPDKLAFFRSRLTGG